MHKIESFKEFIEEELDKIRKKGDLTPAELENADKAVDILKDISIIEGMRAYEENPEAYGDGEMHPIVSRSYGRSYPHMMPDMRYRNYMDGGHMGYDTYGSDWYGARRRDSRGRYMDGMRGYRSGYYDSGEAKEKMAKYLESKMRNASTDEEKEIIRRCMDEIEKDY